MLRKFSRPQLVGLLIGIMGIALFAAACGGDAATPTSPPTATSPAPTATAPAVKEAIKMYSSNWTSIELNTRIPGYILEHGYEYPIDYITGGTTGVMKVAFPTGEMHVVMEIWRANIQDWYHEHFGEGTVVDLAGTGDNVANGSKGQILENSAQGFYVPNYVVEANPGLVSVLDLPDYVDLFRDPEDPNKGVIYNCIIGWACQKINRAKWFAYGLYEYFNVTEPGSAGALDAQITGAYTAGDPVLSYYWEPTTIVNELGLTMLEEPEWTEECQVALDIAVESSPFESTVGCAFPVSDVHSAVHSSLVERAPEVTDFLANVFIGALTLGDLEVWKNENDAEFRGVVIHYLKENRDIWTTWITDANAADIIAKVDAALATDS